MYLPKHIQVFLSLYLIPIILLIIGIYFIIAIENFLIYGISILICSAWLFLTITFLTIKMYNKYKKEVIDLP